MLVIAPGGHVHCLYDELIDLHALGRPTIERGSHVEPDADGSWWADLAPVGGPKLGAFRLRTEALAAERAWLEQWVCEGRRCSAPPEILCWTDGHFFWHDGCVDVSESDCELRAVFKNDDLLEGARCDTCGGPIKEVADDDR